MDIIAINLGERQALLEDGTVVPITDMLDADGDFTDAPEEAVAAVAKMGDGWLAIDLSGFGWRSVH